MHNDAQWVTSAVAVPANLLSPRSARQSLDFLAAYQHHRPPRTQSPRRRMPNSVAHPDHPLHTHRKEAQIHSQPAAGESPDSEEQWEVWDDVVFEVAARAADAPLANTPSSMRPPFTPPTSDEPMATRPRRPLPPIPTQGVNPALPQQPAMSTPSSSPPARRVAPKRSGTRPLRYEGHPHAHSSTEPPLRRRGTLFASDVPVPADYEAPPPFHAIGTDRLALSSSVSMERRNGNFESPPPSPLSGVFPGASPYTSSLRASPSYGTAIGASRPPEVFPRQPERQQSAPARPQPLHASPELGGSSSSRHRPSQSHDAKLPFDPAAFYRCVLGSGS